MLPSNENLTIAVDGKEKCIGAICSEVVAKNYDISSRELSAKELLKKSKISAVSRIKIQGKM